MTNIIDLFVEPHASVSIKMHILYIFSILIVILSLFAPGLLPYFYSVVVGGAITFFTLMLLFGIWVIFGITIQGKMTGGLSRSEAIVELLRELIGYLFWRKPKVNLPIAKIKMLDKQENSSDK